MQVQLVLLLLTTGSRVKSCHVVLVYMGIMSTKSNFSAKHILHTYILSITCIPYIVRTDICGKYATFTCTTDLSLSINKKNICL